MKKFVVMLLILPLAGFAAQEEKPARKSEPVKAKAPLSVPADAKQIEPNTYRYTDSKGKTWIYRRTPFGVTRFEDKPAVQPVEDPKSEIKATEEGDKVRFERQTPFGPVKWERKKSELNQEEREAWERTRSAQAGKAAGEK